MFQFPGLAPYSGSRSSIGRVAPFGNLRLYWLFAPYRSLSQLTTSFIASESLGIRHLLLFTFKTFNLYY